MTTLRSISTKTFRGLAVAFMLAAMQQLAIAQTEPQAESDSSKLRFVDKIWHWVNTYAMSGPDYLTQERLDFKRSAFAEVYINARIDHPNWLFVMLNKVTELRFLETQTPKIIFDVALKPDQAVTGYEVIIGITSSVSINGLSKINTSVNDQYFRGKRFPSPVEAEPLIAEAIVETLTQLAATLGNSLAPDLMVRLGDDVYWNGHAINLLESDGNSIELEAIDKNKNPVPPGQLTWTNADAYQSKGVVDMANTNMKQVQLVRRRSSNDTDNLSVIIRRGSGQPDLKEMLKLLIIEALSTKKQEAITSIETLRRDSVANAAEIRRYLAEIEAGNFPMEGDDVLTPMFERPILRPDSTEIFANKDVGPNLKALKKRKHLRSQIRRKLNVVALADLIVDKPDQVKVLLDELLRNSGRLLANLILSTDGDEQRAQMRDIVLDFLNNNLERIAGGVYPDALSQEPALTAAPASQPKTFDPQKYLYVNERMTFTGKDELIRQFTANVPPDTYVFINYSQDVNVASYQARARGTRPKGLPADAKYKVFTVLHMPGSLLEMNFEDDEESAMKSILHTYCTPDKSLAYQWAHPNQIRTYLTPSGQPINFNSNAPLSNLLFGGFKCEGKTSSEIPSASQQTLSGFTLDGLNYVAVIDISNIPFIGATKFLGYALIPNNTIFDPDKVDSYTYYNIVTTSWESSVTVSVPVKNQYFEDCSLSISKIDFADKSLMKELPCPYLSIDIDIFKLKKDNLETLNQNLFIQVLGKVEHAWQSGRRYYLNEESQTANDYWITQLWNEIYGPYYLVDNLGQIEINSYKLDPQKASVQPTISIARAAKNLKIIGDAARNLMLLGVVINSSSKVDDGVNDANTLQAEVSGYSDVEKLQLITKVVQLRKDVIDVLGNQTLNPEVLRELVHLLHHINEALKNVFGNDSAFPFHLTDHEKLKIEPLPVRTIVPKVDPNTTEPIIIADPTLEDIEKYVRHPDFDPGRYTRPQDEEENYSAYVSVREIKYLDKTAGVTQPLFYVGITTEEDPIERYKNETTSTLVGNALNFEIVDQDLDKSTARGIEQILILLNNNGSSYPAQSKTLDNQRNSTAPSRDVYLYRLIRGYLHLETLPLPEDWKLFYKRPASVIESRLKSTGQWIDNLYTSQK